MKILESQLTLEALRNIAENSFGDMVKAVVDVGRGLIAIDSELHSDLEALLLSDGSSQDDLWGINFYPDLTGDDFLEFDSMINMRPSQGNLSRGIDDDTIRQKVIAVVDTWINR
jgi:hypothetical protein